LDCETAECAAQSGSTFRRPPDSASCHAMQELARLCNPPVQKKWAMIDKLASGPGQGDDGDSGDDCTVTILHDPEGYGKSVRVGDNCSRWDSVNNLRNAVTMIAQLRMACATTSCFIWRDRKFRDYAAIQSAALHLGTSAENGKTVQGVPAWPMRTTCRLVYQAVLAGIYDERTQ